MPVSAKRGHRLAKPCQIGFAQGTAQKRAIRIDFKLVGRVLVIEKFKNGYRLICMECKHAQNEKYCSNVNCSHLWQKGCSCHINPPCGKCLNNHFEEKERINVTPCKSRT